MFISFISINVPKSSPTVCSRSGQSAYLLRYECLRFWWNITRVRRGNWERERESTFFKIICSSSLPLRVPDERTDALHPIKILTRWTRGKIIIIVCLVALNINWRFHHLTIKSHYWIRWNTHIVILHYRSSHELAVFKQSKVERLSAVLSNLESLNKARSAGS